MSLTFASSIKPERVKEFIKGLFTILIFLCIYQITHAQTRVKFSGKITDNRNQPVSGATIEIENGPKLSADADGFFSVDLTVGNHIIVVSATGYQSKKISDINVSEGADNYLISCFGVFFK
jgi:hypothetical protein